MGDARNIVGAALVGLIALIAATGGPTGLPRVAARPAEPADPGAFFALAAGGKGSVLGDRERAAGLRFAGVPPADQAAIEAAIASGRPEAQQAVALVDGLVTVRVGATGEKSLGVTAGNGKAFEVTVDLAGVSALHGARGIARVVWHEFGHVLDYAVVPQRLDQQLDAMVPAGYACRPGEPTSSCAPREERFAETFAKWAMNDIGVDLYIGYKVLPPSVPLADWGAPIAALAS